MTRNEAHMAVIREVSRHFTDEAPTEPPTPKQTALAAKFGYDISNMDRGAGEALIGDIMLQLNREAIRDEGLAPGVRVRNIWDNPEFEQIHVVSSVRREDGTVFFKGGNGRRAWARSLRRDESQAEDAAAPNGAS